MWTMDLQWHYLYVPIHLPIQKPNVRIARKLLSVDPNICYPSHIIYC
jgi:hypothetical protein